MLSLSTTHTEKATDFRRVWNVKRFCSLAELSSIWLLPKSRGGGVLICCKIKHQDLQTFFHQPEKQTPQYFCSFDLQGKGGIFVTNWSLWDSNLEQFFLEHGINFIVGIVIIILLFTLLCCQSFSLPDQTGSIHVQLMTKGTVHILRQIIVGFPDIPSFLQQSSAFALPQIQWAENMGLIWLDQSLTKIRMYS